MIAAALAAAALGVQAAPLRVLFLGNSLTAANDLPAMVAQIGAADGHPVEPTMIAPGGFALEDHWAVQSTHDAVDGGGYDVVVMQQGPSALPDSQANLLEWTQRWAEEMRAHGARPAMYTVWPESYRASYAFGDVIASYRNAATAAGATHCPAGLAWLIAMKRDKRLKLYGGDGFHPTPLGTYLAAIVIYGSLTGSVPKTLPAVDGVKATAKQLAELRAAAVEAMKLEH